MGTKTEQESIDTIIFSELSSFGVHIPEQEKEMYATFIKEVFPEYRAAMPKEQEDQKDPRQRHYKNMLTDAVILFSYIMGKHEVNLFDKRNGLQTKCIDSPEDLKALSSNNAEMDFLLKGVKYRRNRAAKQEPKTDLKLYKYMELIDKILSYHRVEKYLGKEKLTYNEHIYKTK